MRDKAAVSNIAWPAEADEEALTLASRLGFSGIELAPAKVFGPLGEVSRTALTDYREALAARGLRIPALQAILFGVDDAHLFRSDAARECLLARLTRVAEVAGALEAGACVFGAPGLRDPGDLAQETALDIAAAFFARLAPRFADHGTTLAFEANPPIYDCRFVTRTREAMALVARVDTPGFGLQLDMGTVFANEEETETVVAAARACVHCHASEPRLVSPRLGRLRPRPHRRGPAPRPLRWLGLGRDAGERGLARRPARRGGSVVRRLPHRAVTGAAQRAARYGPASVGRRAAGLYEGIRGDGAMPSPAIVLLAVVTALCLGLAVYAVVRWPVDYDHFVVGGTTFAGSGKARDFLAVLAFAGAVPRPRPSRIGGAIPLQAQLAEGGGAGTPRSGTRFSPRRSPSARSWSMDRRPATRRSSARSQACRASSSPRWRRGEGQP